MKEVAHDVGFQSMFMRCRSKSSLAAFEDKKQAFLKGANQALSMPFLTGFNRQHEAEVIGKLLRRGEADVFSIHESVNPRLRNSAQLRQRENRYLRASDFQS